MQAQYITLDDRYLADGQCDNGEFTLSLLIPAKPGTVMTDNGVFMRNGKVKQPPIRKGLVAIREEWMEEDGVIYYKREDPEKFPVWYHPNSLKPRHIRMWMMAEEITLWQQDDGSPFWRITMKQVDRPKWNRRLPETKFSQRKILRHCTGEEVEFVQKTPSRHWLVDDYSVNPEDRMENFRHHTLNGMVKDMFTVTKEERGVVYGLHGCAYAILRRKKWYAFLSGTRVKCRDEAEAKTACLMHLLDKGGAEAGKLRELVRCWFTEMFGG